MSSWVSAILPHRTSDNRAARAGVEEPDTALVARHVGVNQSVTAFLIARSCAQMRREVSADFPATRRYLSQRTLIRRKTEPGRLGTRYADTPTRWPKQLRTRTEGTTDDMETPHLLDRGALHARDPCTGPDNVDELDHSYQRHARKRSRYRWWCQRELFVSYSGELIGSVTNGSRTIWSPNSSFIGGTVTASPSVIADDLRLAGATGTNTITFGSQVTNPLFAIWSLGSGIVASFTFNENPTFEPGRRHT